MNKKFYNRPQTNRLVIYTVVALCALTLIGCEYDVPITEKPTRDIDNSLLGSWISLDGKTTLKISKWDKSNYVVLQDGALYRIYHSDVGDNQLVTVQILERETPTYAYWDWTLAQDGTLLLRLINDKIVPDSTTDSAAVQNLLKENRQNPALFDATIRYRRTE